MLSLYGPLFYGDNYSMNSDGSYNIYGNTGTLI